ncbi:MAG: hypothetical protein JWQ38_2960 [Flavipsychrobacter sp.]|nr:hypothetical protein [Flavipsychrobacter sp.]
MEAYIGSIWSFGFNFAPVGWALCNGALLPIAEYQALFALIGTTYGGDGMTTFAVPDLRSRVPVGQGQGPGLSNYVIGQMAGTEQVTLTSANLAPHNHGSTVKFPVGSGDSPDPTNRYFGSSDTTVGDTYLSTAGATMRNDTGNTGLAGNSMPISIIDPYQAINYCICAEGIFPSRN